jgi:heptosyltransferase-2
MKMALFLPNWVGDVVMATPAIRAIRNRYPSSRIVGLGRSYVRDVLAGSPWLDEFIPFNRGILGRDGLLAMVRRLRQERIDHVVLFPNSLRPALAAWLGGCRHRVGYSRYGRGPLLTDALQPSRDDRGRIPPHPILPAYNRLAEALGCSDVSSRMQLFTTPHDETVADKVWAQTGLAGSRGVVCLNPGAAFGSAKLWPAESFAALARDLVQRRRLGVLVLCGPAERDLARRVVHLAGLPEVWSLADFPVSIGLTKACIRRCDLLISTDSGPRHFGAAFGRPVVALFGPTWIDWTETFYGDEIKLQKSVPCGPCQQRVCPTDHQCMTTLTPAEVFAAAATLLDRNASRFRHAG